MSDSMKNVHRERINFAKIPSVFPIPDLLEVQKQSYARFLQSDKDPSERSDRGLQGVFTSVFPITDFRGTSSLEFVDYVIGEWEGKYSIDECKERGMHYAVPLRVKIRLVVWDTDPKTEVKTIRDIKEQEVYFGDIPAMTENGIFIINGTERVIVSQLHRSPGCFYEADPDKHYYLAKIIPYRGSWVEFEYDKKGFINVRIDRKRKFLATTFLRALGLNSDTDILGSFYRPTTIQIHDEKLWWQVDDNLVGRRLTYDIAKGKKVIVPAGRKLTRNSISNFKKAGVTEIEVAIEDLAAAVSLGEVVDQASGEILVEANQDINGSVINAIMEAGITGLDVIFPSLDEVGPMLSDTVRKDPIKTTDEALIEIYRKQRPGDPPTIDTATALFEGMFFDPRKYDFSRVGRLKFNIKLGLETPLDQKTLTPQDFYEVIRYLLRLKQNFGAADDIDHLGNRRVRAVGELLENQFRVGLVRMERAIKEKMSVHQEMPTAMPHDLINAKPVMAAIREFFGSSQLSQFMDQTNPLSEITHKRRLSALGPGGLSRERAGFEVRDVHPTHYGRICPVETPEGPNIGLISSLASYARVDEYGFIESPYRKVEKGRIIDYVKILESGSTNFKVGEAYPLVEVEKANAKAKNAKAQAEYAPHAFYLTAWEGDKHHIAQANVVVDDKNCMVADRVSARYKGDFVFTPVEEIGYVDVSPKQLVSVAANLIPFLENDDANRALMGSNMQRQAVPLLHAEAPFVGTGMEYIAARDSGAVVVCRRSGVIETVDSARIVVRATTGKGQTQRGVGVDIYKLIKFQRSNQNTCINQKPLVKEGDTVQKGQILADGPCVEKGELALGRNILVAFMPWRGYNFEDAILVSEKLVKKDTYTSIHITELEVEARDTKLGAEEITRDIPNVSDSILADLDESGIIRLGASVRSGDMLVGKVTPKGETQLTPEEKLLRAIFGEKAGEVKDASLYTPAAVAGTVVDVKIFSRKGVELDERSKLIAQEEVARLKKDLEDEIRIFKNETTQSVIDLLEGKKSLGPVTGPDGSRIAKKGDVLNVQLLSELSYESIFQIKLDTATAEEVAEIENQTVSQIERMNDNLEERLERMQKGDELPPGVIRMVKVYVAMKRKLSVGDKMAGRHGNKGVIARILPEEDMPYLPDGTPVEIVLNPLGVPSRMNVGQVLETHLGWAAKALGLHYATPVFDGARESEIKAELAKAGLPENGKTVLHDGLTGERFDQEVTVGYIYMLKLSHLVDDKIHARSIGPYSLITQQPLGGKAQFGGQRFGEMEVWALEAYGAASILQELLTAKSDDVQGRAKIYEAIVKGESSYSPGIPESFNVLIRELQSLGLDVELIERPRRQLPDQDMEAAVGVLDQVLTSEPAEA
jgi:DNA-directed RNA polymerase subunit beta